MASYYLGILDVAQGNIVGGRELYATIFSEK
jgi:hypothetical protein